VSAAGAIFPDESVEIPFASRITTDYEKSKRLASEFMGETERLSRCS
jgi:hypothetical protein